MGLPDTIQQDWPPPSSGPPAAGTTVVIPVWDRYAGNRLEQAMESVAAQDRRPVVIVVDNASAEALPKLLGAVVVRSPTRVSLGAARNLGLAEVSTPNVIFWDADDLMLPGTVAFLEDRLEADPRLVAYGAAIIEEPGGARHRWPRRWIRIICRWPGLMAALDTVWSVFPTTGSTIMRTTAVRECGGFADAGSGEDWCLGVSLAYRGRFGWSERPGRSYLQRPGSVWSSHSGVRHQLRHATAVRSRLREDPAIPANVKQLLWVVAAAQAGAVAAHVAVSSIRRAVRLVGRGATP